VTRAAAAGSHVRGRAARVTLAGLAVIAAYTAAAAWSGNLSVTARRPVLDGIGPVVAYRWVVPPSDLAPTNIAPSAGTFRLAIKDTGTVADVQFTSDDQFDLVAPRDMVLARDDATSVHIEVTPLDPSKLAPLPGELVPFGNAYRLQLAYAPGGGLIHAFNTPPKALLLYPVTMTLHAAEHTLLFSEHGKEWTKLDTTDTPAMQQVEAEVERPGFLVVAAVPSANPVSSPPAGSTVASTASTILLVVAGATLLVGIGLLIRARRDG
jgi:hypothetical protein